MAKLKRIDVLSLAKLQAVIGALGSLIVGICYTIIGATTFGRFVGSDAFGRGLERR